MWEVGDVVSIFDLWFHTYPKVSKVPIWRMTFIALVWTIWRLRNIAVFQWVVFCDGGCFEMFHFDVAWWVKAEWGEHVPCVADIIRSPESIEAPKRPGKIKQR